MRTLLAGEFDTATATDPRADVDVKVEVENGSGTFISLNTLRSTRWTASVEYGEHVNNKVATATITLVQQILGDSLAPLIASSAVNVLDDNVTYSPLIDVGRLIKFSTATTAHGVAPVAGDYRLAFTGRISRYKINDQGGLWAGPITLECSDLGAWLVDLQVEAPGKQYGTDPGTPLETVLQAVIDDNLPAGDPAVTVVKTSASTFAVTQWKQGEGKVFEALQRLVLDSVGEDIRYRFDASHNSTLQWIDPDRSRTTVDGTFPKESYILRTLDTAIDDVRNAGSMPFTDVDAGTAGDVTAESLASIDKYRRRYFRMPESTLLTTKAEAQTALNAVVNDLSAPLAEAQATVPFCWFVQLFDRYTFEANGRQYSDDQTFSVVGYRHSIQNGRASTTLTLAGRVVGAYAEWLKRIKKGGSVYKSANIVKVSSTESTDGTTRDFTLVIGSRVDTVHVWYRTVPVNVVGDPLDFSGNEALEATYPATLMIKRRELATNNVTFSIPHPSKGYRVAGRMIPYTFPNPDPTEGDSWPFFVDPAGEVSLVQRARITASTATTVTVRVAVADPYPGSPATITYTETGGTGAACSPVSGGTVTPEATLSEAAGTYIDYTITRPAFGSAPRRVTFTATATGRNPDTDAVDVQAAEGPGPVMDVYGTPGTTSFTVTYTATGTLEYSVDGAAYTSVPASPFNVTRNAAGGADKILTFRCTRNSQTATSMLTVPAQVATGTGSEPTITFGGITTNASTYDCDGANNFDFAWTGTNMPAAATYDVTYTLTNGLGGTGGGTNVTSPFTTSNHTICPGATVRITISAKVDGVVIATRTFEGSV